MLSQLSNHTVQEYSVKSTWTTMAPRISNPPRRRLRTLSQSGRTLIDASLILVKLNNMQLHKEVKVGDLIRTRKTRNPFLVVGKNSQGLLIVDLQVKNDPYAEVKMILPAYNSSWERDIEMVDLDAEEAKLIEENLPLIDAVEETAEMEVAHGY